MTTYLLTWNPARWSWDNLPEAARQTAQGEPFRQRWSCGNTKKIRRGDRLFLLKQGGLPRGIMAAGWSVSNEPYLAAHWNPERAAQGEEALRVDVEFECILVPGRQHLVPISRLQSGPLARVFWSTQKGGIELDSEEAAELERAWKEHLSDLAEDEKVETPPAGPVRQNPAWQRDELILALDLYFRHPPSSIGQEHPEVVALSDLLNSLPIHIDRPDAEHFRNPNGVYMKLCNFLRFDPDYHGKGLTRGSRLEKEIWDCYAGDRLLLGQLADAIRRGQPIVTVQATIDEEEDEFPEGRIIYRLHRSRERNRELVRQAKARAKARDGRLLCLVCKFNFEERYGALGVDFIECHHTRPLSELTEERPSRLDEVALVCSNCHRMIHRKRPWLRIDELVAVLRS